MFFASTTMKFQKVIGVEFSGPIIDIARANNNKFLQRDISFNKYGCFSRFKN